MIKRTIEQSARMLWQQYPVVTITGPRQSGKTTLAKAVFPECGYVNLEALDVRAEVAADPRGFLQRHSAPVIFDEIQNVPALVSYLQEIVDEKGTPSLFILTGSHQPALQAAITQSLAGRTALLELLPLSIEEVASTTTALERDKLLYTGFMPRAYHSQIQPQRLYADYFKTYVERDIRQLANLKNLNLFETFLRLLAGRIGQVLNLNSLATDVGVSSTTIKEWLSLLETSYIITILHPYYRNFGKRFIRAPKVYFVETGLAAYLLGIRSEKQIATHPLVGNLFENMIVVDLLKQRLNQGLAPDMYYMRTSNGVEVDVVQENEGKLDLYEIKSGATFNKEMAKNLLTLRATIGDEIGLQTVIYAGHTASLAEGIQYKNFKDRC